MKLNDDDAMRILCSAEYIETDLDLVAEDSAGGRFKRGKIIAAYPEKQGRIVIVRMDYEFDRETGEVTLTRLHHLALWSQLYYFYSVFKIKNIREDKIMPIIIKKSNEVIGKLHLEVPRFTVVRNPVTNETVYYPESEFFTPEFTAVTDEASAYVGRTLGIRNPVRYRMKDGENRYVFTESGDESVYCNLMYSEDPRELGTMLFHLVRELFLTWIRDGSETAPDRFGPCNRKKIREYPDAVFYADVFAVAVMDLLWPRWDITGTKKRILSSKKGIRCFRRMKISAKKRFR